MTDHNHLEIQGHCPICEKDTTFVAQGEWYRDTLFCQTCPNGSVPRERALAHILKRERPNWRDLAIHESSPTDRGISLQLRNECRQYVSSHYFSDQPFGTIIGAHRNENIENQTFPSATFDIVVSLDVTEHVFDPSRLFMEVYRTLKPGGIYVSTFPIRKWQVEATIKLAHLNPDGSIEFFKEPPEYHGNPIDNKGSLVTYDYGYDIHQQIASWSLFDVEVTRFSDRFHGLLGEYTEVLICHKRK